MGIGRRHRTLSLVSKNGHYITLSLVSKNGHYITLSGQITPLDMHFQSSEVFIQFHRKDTAIPRNMHSLDPNIKA